MTTNSSDETKIAVMANDISYIKQALVDIKEQIADMSQVYVTKAEFYSFKQEIEGKLSPFSKVGWSIALFIITTLLGLILYHIFTKP